MENLNEVDRRVLGAIKGPERLRLLIRDAGFETMTLFAVAIGKHQQEVSYCINGDRPYPEIRDELAKHLQLERAEIDRLIDGEPARAAEEVA